MLITIGAEGKLIAAGARAAGFAKKSIVSFETREEAEEHVIELLEKRDLVLVKGAHALRLDRLVDALRAR